MGWSQQPGRARILRNYWIDLLAQSLAILTFFLILTFNNTENQSTRTKIFSKDFKIMHIQIVVLVVQFVKVPIGICNIPT